MANYGVDIEVALKGVDKLRQFDKLLSHSVDELNRLEKALKKVNKQNPYDVTGARRVTELDKKRTEYIRQQNRLLSEQERSRRAIASEVARTSLAEQAAARRTARLEVQRRPIAGLAYPEGAGPGMGPEAQRNIDIARMNRERMARMRQGVTMYPEPIGPGQASFMRSPVEARLKALIQLERATEAFNQAEIKHAAQINSSALKNADAVFKLKLSKLELLGKKELEISRQTNEAALRDFDRRLQNRVKRRQRTQAMGGQAKTALSSALIGGGFPLLFGQGGVAAAGGAIGGGLGGILGGGFGFALSIVGTAIGDAITKAAEFEKSLIKLNARTADLGAASTVTGKDVDVLAKSLSIAKEDAMELFAAFAEFDRVADKQSLALIFGDDPGRFDRLAAATTEAKLAEEIFADRKRIGNETAGQLLDQLKLGNAAAVELGLAEARLRIAEKQAIKDAERVTLMDRILAAAATSQMAMDIMDPAVFGQERGEKLAKEFDKNRQERLDAFKKSLEEVRDLIKQVSGFQPDKAGEKAAREEERRRKAAQKLLDASTKRVRELARETELVRRTTEFRDKIAELERVGDSSSAIRQQGELRLFEIEQARQLQIERINPKLEEQARLLEEAGINAKSLADADEARADTARRLADLAYRNAQNIREATYKNSEQNKLFERQQALAQGISNTLGTSMMLGFEALITGAQRFDEALRNIVVYTLQEMARQLLKILVIEQAIEAIRGFLSPKTIPFPDHPTHGNVPMQPLPALPKKALGGAVSAGQSYIVGEKGPELFMPGAKGNIIPNSALGGMGGGSITVNVDAKGSTVEGNGDQANQLGKVIGAAIQQELIKQKKPGGLLA